MVNTVFRNAKIAAFMGPPIIPKPKPNPNDVNIPISNFLFSSASNIFGSCEENVDVVIKVAGKLKARASGKSLKEKELLLFISFDAVDVRFPMLDAIAADIAPTIMDSGLFIPIPKLNAEKVADAMSVDVINDSIGFCVFLPTKLPMTDPVIDDVPVIGPPMMDPHKPAFIAPLKAETLYLSLIGIESNSSFIFCKFSLIFSKSF